jgi:hypothetical protein
MKLTISSMALAVAFAFATAAQAQMTPSQTGKTDAGKPATAQTDPAREARKAEDQRIEAAYKADKAKCDPMKGNAKDICMAEAKGKEKVAKAELNAKDDKDQAKAQRKVQDAKAEAAYDVAKQKCDDQKGEAKDACVKQARVERDQAKGKAEKTAETKTKERPAAGGTAPATGTTSPEKPKKSY